MFFNSPGTSSEQLRALAETVVGKPRNSDAIENFALRGTTQQQTNPIRDSHRFRIKKNYLP
jgi:hypothetical protein